MAAAHKADPLTLTMIAMLAAVATGTFAFGTWFDAEWIRYRGGALALSLVVALGLFLREQPWGRLPSLVCGVLVVLFCGLQLAAFIVDSQTPERLTLLPSVTHSFAAGMFCGGSALVLDSLLPARWGRHLLFGLLGAISALIGAAGIIAVFSGTSLDLDATLLGGMRLPGSLIVLLAGLGLLVGARLRSSQAMESRELPVLDEELKDRSGVAAALAVLVVTVFATLLIWRQVQEQNQRQLEEGQSDAMHRFSGMLVSNVLSAETLLNGVRGLFAASEHVDPEEWFRYFDQFSLRHQYPGVFAVAYAARVENPTRTGAGRGEIGVDGRMLEIWPASDHEVRYPTVYRVPRSDGLDFLVGLDMGAMPVLAEVVSKAEGAGSPTVSGRVDFADLRDPESRSGFIVVLPLADRQDPASPVPLDSVGVTGITYCAWDMRELVRRTATDSRTESFALRIVDITTDPDGIALYTSHDFDATRPAASTTLNVGSRSWVLSAQNRPAFTATPASRNPGTVLAGGFFVAIVLFAVTWVLTAHRARAVHLARRINRELERAQRAQRAVTETAKAGIITADSAGNILYMNPSAALEFGVDAEAMQGTALTALMPERFREAHTRGLERAAAGGERRAIGRTLELAGLRADGTEFPIEILLSAWASENETYFTAFVTDISERRLAQAELTRRAQELERSNADLEQFAYVASHDLQEPLRMVASYVQLLARRYRGRLDPDADEFIGFAVDGATRMQNLIEDLLAFARVGRSGMVPVPTDARTCAEAALRQLRESIGESGAEIRIELSCSVLAVPAQLTQVFQNLLANALKFHGADVPRVTIDAKREDPHWHIRVVDNGIGIEAKHSERVFAIFQRLHTRSEYSGTGIGLAICRRIIDSFGGRIWVESMPGSGSVFHFLIPQSGEVS